MSRPAVVQEGTSMANETNATQPVEDPKVKAAREKEEKAQAEAKQKEADAKAKQEQDAADAKAAQEKTLAEDQAAKDKELNDRLAALEQREKELADREAAAKAAPQQIVQVVPGQNFNMQNAMQQDANSRARKLRTNEMPGGTKFRVPVMDPLTGQVTGWKMVNGRGERVDE
jgi:membrane protein involved in colicin uptake